MIRARDLDDIPDRTSPLGFIACHVLWPYASNPGEPIIAVPGVTVRSLRRRDVVKVAHNWSSTHSEKGFAVFRLSRIKCKQDDENIFECRQPHADLDDRTLLKKIPRCRRAPVKSSAIDVMHVPKFRIESNFVRIAEPSASAVPMSKRTTALPEVLFLHLLFVLLPRH
jgi:hypothetical protein